MREGHAERGFTLIELMVVVGIVAILAAVVIPSFLQSSTKSKARSETAAMFTEIATKQAQFYAEQSAYAATGTSPYTGTSTCPSAVPTADYNFKTTCMTTSSVWELLRIVPTESELRCQYTVTTGANGSTLTPPTGFKNSQGAVAAEPTLSGSWWFLHAKCSNTGTGSFSEYYTSSVDRRVQALNEGR